MIRLNLVGNDYKYELENIIQLFFPDEQVSLEKGDKMHITAKVRGDELSVLVKCEQGSYYSDERCYNVNDYERTLCFMLYNLLSNLTGISAGWGIQTGVRPVKLLRTLEQNGGVDYAKGFMLDKMLVHGDKYRLAKRVLDIQRPILADISPRDFSLYVGIPFCKSRCSYCSFVSHDISKSVKLIPDFCENLVKELGCIARIAKDLDLRLRSVYIGGGTPTAIDANNLDKIMAAINDNFDFSACREYTVEAGRPDTIDSEKLEIIKRRGATRISINPQTLNDEVLKKIRRNHTAEDFYRAFSLARALGFDNINTDIIAGLDGDDVASFCTTVGDILALEPECITVHTLSVKRSSRMVYKNEAKFDAKGENVSKMLGYATEKLDNAGYAPYYMYRQSRQAGNNENIGWAKPGCESFYNVYIMEEMQTILAAGGGASSKLVDARRGNIKRIFNYKYPYEYISGFDEMIRRKDEIYDFYKELENGN